MFPSVFKQFLLQILFCFLLWLLWSTANQKNAFCRRLFKIKAKVISGNNWENYKKNLEELNTLGNALCWRNWYKSVKHNCPFVQRSPWTGLAEAWRCFREAWLWTCPVLKEFPIYFPLLAVINSYGTMWIFAQMQQLLCSLFI